MPRFRLRWLWLVVVVFALSACSTLQYYWQAASGHLAIMNKVEPIAEILGRPDLDPQLKTQLELAQRARDFASRELQLPDNDSYRGYADLGRAFVVWNVIATPELSIQPQQWCFLFVGCITYRGYFAKADAEQFAAELKAKGMDTFVGGVAAYSTLGYFDDPLLNTMLRNDESALVGVILHELAHQLIYIEDDTAFNEAFATAVEYEGLRRWFAAQQKSNIYDEFLQRQQQRREFYGLLHNTRRDLQRIYATPLQVEEKREHKRQCLANLKAEYSAWKQRTGDTRFDGLMSQDLNNAHLAIIATYHDLVPAFTALLASTDGDLPAFYRAVKQLGELEYAERHAKLSAYSDHQIPSLKGKGRQ